MKKACLKLLLVCFSIAFSLLLAELLLSVFLPQDLSSSWRVQNEKGLLVNKSSGAARHQFKDRVVHYNFSEPHLRGNAPEGSIKVLALGDSFTFGWLLNDTDTYVSILQSRLDEKFGQGVFSLLNAAAGGWGTADYVAFVEDAGEEIAPDIILVFLNVYDIGRALVSPLWKFSDGKLTRLVVPRNQLKSFLNRLLFYNFLITHSHLVQLVRIRVALAREYLPTFDPKSAKKAKVLGVALFRRLDEWCKERGVKLIVSSTGWHEPPYTNQSEPTQVFMSSSELIFESLSIPFSDPSKYLWQKREAKPDKYSIPDDDHPNEMGAALIAEHVYPFVESELEQYLKTTSKKIE